MRTNAGARIPDFSFLDLKEFQNEYAQGPAQNQIRFYIGGIRCAKCVRKLESLPLTLPGLLRLEVEMGSSTARAEIDTQKLSFKSLADTITSMGFEPVPIRPDEDPAALEKRESRRELTRLGVAAACAGNIMTFSFAVYLGAADAWLPVFGWLSFALYLPVLTYVAWPFYQGAWRSLKSRQLSIDLPMSVASLAGFAFSFAELVRGGRDFYFDSLSGFLFLILLSRFAQARLQRSYLRAGDLTEAMHLQKVRQGSAAGWTWRPLSAIITGDRILLQASEVLPCEAELISAKASFSLAWLSGEARPRTFLRGATVPAGARLSYGTAHLRVSKLLPDTAFGRIMSEVQKFSLSRNRMVGAADRLTHYLLLAVFLLAAVFFTAYYTVSPEEAFRRSLALIILACPCAMAFGTPLAIASSLRKARRQGLVIRDANVLERVNGIKTIYFDKTGTLTETELSLVTSPESIPVVYQKIILSLENESLHPVAFAFRKTLLPNYNYLPPVENWRETPGQGVSGLVYGRFYEIKRGEPGSGFTCALYEDNHFVQGFTFEARLQDGCRAVLDDLRSRGYRVALLSGDSEKSGRATAAQLGFETGDAFFGMTPESKAAVVKSTPHAMMIGDGINDGPALMAAQVGVAVSGGVEAALRSSPVYLGDAGLQGILTLLDCGRRTQASIRQNLAVSIAYNSAGAVLALLGYINPLLAALLMPLSSAMILVSTWLRGRQ